MSRIISRDPFARQEIHSSVVDANGTYCSWCGSKGKWTKSRGFRLKRFTVVPDGLEWRANELKGFFCGVDCMRAYHE